MTTSKTTVTLGGFALGGVSSIAWRLTTGTKPYTTTFSVPSRTWRSMSQQMGKPLDLVIHDRSRSVKIKGVYILHTIASDSPNRTSFIVADKRWKWPYKLIARDYNSAKRTGTRTLVSNVPVPGAVTKDEYDYREYSLEDGETRWTPKSALTDMLEQLDREFGTAPKSKGFVIESLPIEGEFSLQDVMMRDQGDVALAKLLSYIPGAAVYIDTEGKARVINAADLDAAERYRKRIPPATWDGEKSEMIDRSKIRPSKVIVYYQREVEAAFEFADSYADTAAALGIAAPFLENVIPTVDPETEITTTIDGVPSTRTVPAGTWVEASQWLEVMNDQKPAVSWPWTFDTISKHWLDGNLDGALGNRPNDDLDEDGNVAWRVQALKKHWRQTFRINPKYMDRIRDVQAKRVGVFDTVTGQRTPAAVWGQITIISTDKGEMINFRKDPKRRGLFTLHNTLPGVGVDLKDMPSAPLSVSMIDADIGVFHVGFIASPYGTDARHLPCFTVWESDTATPKSHSRDLVFQNDVPMSQGVRIEAGTSAEILKPQMEMKVMLTIVPGAPNNKSQFHGEEVTAEQVRELYQSQYRITGGDGPPLEIFIPPSEMAARFTWETDDTARDTLTRLLGIGETDPNRAGLVDDPDTEKVDESLMNGYIFANEGGQGGEPRHLKGHAQAVAAEAMAMFADNLHGSVATRLPSDGVKLKGNMSGATIQVASALSAKVNVVHEFPGQQQQIGRRALMPEAVRQLALGILPFGKGGER